MATPPSPSPRQESQNTDDVTLTTEHPAIHSPVPQIRPQSNGPDPEPAMEAYALTPLGQHSLHSLRGRREAIEVFELEEAKAAGEKVLAVDPTFTLSRDAPRICAFQDPALNEKTLENLRQAGLPG